MEKQAQDRLINNMKAGARKSKAFCEASEMVKGILEDIKRETALADDMERLVYIAINLPEPPLNYDEVLTELQNRTQQYLLLKEASAGLLENDFLMEYFKSDVEYIHRQHQLLFIRYAGMKQTFILGK